MKAPRPFHNSIVAALGLRKAAVAVLLGLALLGTPLLADEAKLDDLFAKLKSADEQASGRIESEIWIEWSKSGSPSMDLLLERGRNAMAEGYPQVAIEHFTALIDHDPEFAEGWNARATAYFEAGMLGPSISDIGHALQLNPRHFGALAGLGMIFEQLGQPEKALEVYQAALAIHPHLAGVLEAVERLKTETQGQDL